VLVCRESSENSSPNERSSLLGCMDYLSVFL
jgi:hypothetical protein